MTDTNDLVSSSAPRAPFDYLFKILVVGAAGCGKSSLVQQFTDGTFYAEHVPTLGVEFSTHMIQLLDSVTIKMQIWDTCGQETYQAITMNYFRGSQAAFLVYDITRRETFTVLYKWLEEIHKNCPPNTVVVLIGNKNDLEPREVTFEDGIRFSEENDLEFLETSAKTAYNVQEAFYKIAQLVYRLLEQGVIDVERHSPLPDKRQEKDEDVKLRQEIEYARKHIRELEQRILQVQSISRDSERVPSFGLDTPCLQPQNVLTPPLFPGQRMPVVTQTSENQTSYLSGMQSSAPVFAQIGAGTKTVEIIEDAFFDPIVAKVANADARRNAPAPPCDSCRVNHSDGSNVFQLDRNPGFDRNRTQKHSRRGDKPAKAALRIDFEEFEKRKGDPLPEMPKSSFAPQSFQSLVEEDAGAADLMGCGPVGEPSVSVEVPLSSGRSHPVESAASSLVDLNQEEPSWQWVSSDPMRSSPSYSYNTGGIRTEMRDSASSRVGHMMYMGSEPQSTHQDRGELEPGPPRRRLRMPHLSSEDMDRLRKTDGLVKRQEIMELVSRRASEQYEEPYYQPEAPSQPSSSASGLWKWLSGSGRAPEVGVPHPTTTTGTLSQRSAAMPHVSSEEIERLRRKGPGELRRYLGQQKEDAQPAGVVGRVWGSLWSWWGRENAAESSPSSGEICPGSEEKSASRSVQEDGDEYFWERGSAISTERATSGTQAVSVQSLEEQRTYDQYTRLCADSKDWKRESGFASIVPPRPSRSNFDGSGGYGKGGMGNDDGMVAGEVGDVDGYSYAGPNADANAPETQSADLDFDYFDREFPIRR